APIMQTIEELSGHRYGRRMDDELDTAVRVLCDHARASTFLITDGVIPSNEGRGYVLRRIIRRGIRFGRKLPKHVVLSNLVDAVIESMGSAYPELRARRERTISGEEIFRLYDTHGIPEDLIAEMAEDEGVTLNRAGFELLMSEAKARSKESSKFKSATDAATFARIAEKTGPVEFVGYDQYVDVPSVVKAIVIAGEERDAIPHGAEGEVVLSPTPFYAESGGQIGDSGFLEWEGGRATVLDTQKQAADLAVS